MFEVTLTTDVHHSLCVKIISFHPPLNPQLWTHKGITLRGGESEKKEIVRKDQNTDKHLQLPGRMTTNIMPTSRSNEKEEEEKKKQEVTIVTAAACIERLHVIAIIPPEQIWVISYQLRDTL